MSARDCRATAACGTSRQTAHMSSVSSSVDVALEYCSIEHLIAAELVVGTEIRDTFERSNKTFLRVTCITVLHFPVPRFQVMHFNHEILVLHFPVPRFPVLYF